MGIALKVFAVYMVIFLLIFWRDRKKGKGKTRGHAAYWVPIGAVVVIVLLSVLKVFISGAYIIIILLVLLGVVTLTYWHSRKR